MQAASGDWDCSTIILSYKQLLDATNAAAHELVEQYKRSQQQQQQPRRHDDRELHWYLLHRVSMGWAVWHILEYRGDVSTM
jgi:hypothetical protein